MPAEANMKNMDKCMAWIHKNCWCNPNKQKRNKTMCPFHMTFFTRGTCDMVYHVALLWQRLMFIMFITNQTHLSP